MIQDLRMLRDRLEVAEEELARIPRHEFNRTKVADREHAIEVMKGQIARLERMHQSFQDRRAELLARCGQFRTAMH